MYGERTGGAAAKRQDWVWIPGWFYSRLTKIRTRRRAADSTNSTEPVRPVLGRLREPFPLSRGGATPYRFLLIRYICLQGRQPL